MRLPGSKSPRLFTCTAATLALVVSACDGGSVSQGPPTSPTSFTSNYSGDMTVVSTSGPLTTCPSSLRLGDTGSGVFWRVFVHGDTISLTKELDWSFAGTIQGRAFTATYRPATAPQDPCEASEASISGTFSEDFATFEAREAVLWGSQASTFRAEASWNAQRIP